MSKTIVIPKKKKAIVKKIIAKKYVAKKVVKKKAPTASQAKLKIMVASTVYNFQTELTQICGILNSYGYEVINSHIGTVKVHPKKSNLKNCTAAVESCDLILGIVRPFYGSGVIQGKAITHHEISKAIELDKPRWFLTHGNVSFARQLLQQYRYRGKNRRNHSFRFMKTAVMDNVKVIELYDEIIRTDVKVDDRTGNWNQEYFTIDDIFRYLKTQFKDKTWVRQVISDMTN